MRVYDLHKGAYHRYTMPQTGRRHIIETVRRSHFLRACVVAGACAALVAPSWAEGASLGEMTVLSARGEPLRARIAIEHSGLGRLDGARVRLTPRDDQRRLGIAPLDHPPLTLSLRRDDSGKAWVEVRSQVPVQRSYLRIVVDAWFPPSLIAREYAALIPRRGGRGWTSPTSTASTSRSRR